MIRILFSIKSKFTYYYDTNPLQLYFLSALIIFILYTLVDYTNTYIFTFYPIYNSIYAKGVGDSIYFSNAVNSFLSHKSLPSSNFDGGLLALLIYIVPVSFSNLTHLDLGLSFRVFYLIMLLITGFFINLIGKNLYNPQTGLMLSLLYICNPLIFLLSVWAGSEEIIETVFFVVIIFFVVQNKPIMAIIFTLFACFYKYYSILFLPLIIISIDDKKRKTLISAVLSIFFTLSAVFIFLFLNKYIENIIHVFVASFNIQGKGIFDLLSEYGKITHVSQVIGVLYYSIIILVIIIFYWYTQKSKDPFKYGFVLLIFFIMYPEFYSSYLIIPYVCVVLYYPKISSNLSKINFFILPILSFMSEFSFNHVDSPYALLHIQPTIFLRLIGVVSLICLYVLLIYWLITYIKLIRREKVELGENLDSDN